MLTEDEQREVVDAVDEWLSAPGVVSVKVWTKVRGGTDTGDQAVVVGVVQKRPATELAPEDLTVPPSVTVTMSDGRAVTLPTDVVEQGEIRTAATTDYLRPCPGGYKVACYAGTQWQAGTIGVSMGSLANPKRLVFVTSFHVVSPDGTSVPNRAVYQPDASADENLLGSVCRFLELTTYPSAQQKSPRFNQYDIAWCDPADDDTLAQLTVPGLTVSGKVGGAVDQKATLSWLGQVTGSVLSGTVTSTVAKTVITLGQAPQQSYAYFENAIEVTGTVAAQAGDSGAAVLDNTGRLVGLVFARTTASRATYICPIPPSSLWPN